MSREGVLQSIAHVRIFCEPRDWECAAAFYRKLLDLSERYVDVDHGVAVFNCGGDVTLGVERIDPEDEEDRALVSRFTGISFRVADIIGAYDRLSERGVSFDGPPERMAWGGLLAHFRDPSGNTLTLVQEPNDG